MPDPTRTQAGEPAATWKVWATADAASVADELREDRPQMTVTRLINNGPDVQLTWHATLPPGALVDDEDVHPTDGYLVAQASLPRLMHGSNIHDLAGDEIADAAGRLIGLAAYAAGVTEPAPERVRVIRADLVTQRRLSDGAAVEAQIKTLAEAGRILMPGRWRFALHRSKPAGFSRRALTAMWAQNYRSIYVYDKEQESGDPAARGLVRYEIRHQGKSMTRHLGLRRLPELTATTVQARLNEYMQYFPVFEPDETLADRVLRRAVEVWGPRLGRQRGVRLVGFLSGQYAGEWAELPYSTQARYRQQIRELFGGDANVLLDGSANSSDADEHGGMVDAGGSAGSDGAQSS